MSTTQQVLVAAQPAPLHRRFFAYLIDLTIIGTPAGAAGSLMFGPLSDLGEFGRLIGAVLVALYFGYLDSRLGGGRSLGKRLLGLQVVMLTGGLMSPMSAAARALIVATPTLLNGVSVGDDLAPIALVLIVGLGLSLGYLAIFNRPSHRSLHDLATATIVVRLTAELPTARPMRRFRWGAVAIFLALVVLAPVGGLLIIAAVSLVYLAVIFHRPSHRSPHDIATGRVISIGQLILFSTKTGDAWLLDPSDQLAARLARDGDPEPIHIEETDTTFAIGWKGHYRIEGPAFVYLDRDTGRTSTILGYPTHQLTHIG